METFEKASDTEVRIITPTERIVSLDELVDEQAKFVKMRQDVVDRHTQELANFDTKIAALDTQITEAKKAGVKTSAEINQVAETINKK